MKTLANVVLILVVAFGLPLLTRAGEFTITVEVDETTTGDLEMIYTAVSTATDGSEVSKSLRKVAMGVVGELQLLLAKRIDDSGFLRLDDGAVVGLLGQDRIVVAAGDPLDKSAQVTFKCLSSECRARQPVCVAVRVDGGAGTGTFILRVGMAVPPARVSVCHFLDETCIDPCAGMQ